MAFERQIKKAKRSSAYLFISSAILQLNYIKAILICIFQKFKQTQKRSGEGKNRLNAFLTGGRDV